MTGGERRLAERLEHKLDDDYLLWYDVPVGPKQSQTAYIEAFQQRLWNMFPHSFGGVMSRPQLDRVRWNMFPEVRVQTQGALFDDGERGWAKTSCCLAEASPAQHPFT